MKLEQLTERRLLYLLGSIFVAWGTYMLFMKFRLLHFGLATDDLFNYLNALHNTNFSDKWLFTARYEKLHGHLSLLFNHWQPTLLLLYPVAKVAGAEGLLVVQALGPIWAAVFLLKITEHVGLAPFERLYVIVICLFHPAMMAAVMDSLYGFHGTTLLLYFGAPLAWAAITGRWWLAVVLLVFFLNVRESGAFYIAGAAIGYIVFRNSYFRRWRHVIVAGALTAVVFIFATIVIPKIFNVTHIHVAQATSALSSLDAILHFVSKMDSDWHYLFLWLWPALASPGTLMAMLPDAFILIVVGKKASHWYGMSLVFAGSIAAAYGILKLREFALSRNKNQILTGIMVLHIIGIGIAGPKEVYDQTQKLVTRIGIQIPMESKRAARDVINDQCRTTVEFQAMYGYGDLPYLQYPRQANISKYIVSIPKMPSGLTQWVNANQADLKVIYEDEYLKVFENTSRPCF